MPRLALWLCGPSSRISWPKPCRAKNRIRYGSEQDRDRERHARGDEDTPHATGSRSCTSASASRSRPTARDALTSTTSPGASSARSRSSAAATSANGPPAPVLGGADRHEVVHAQLGGGRRDLRVGGGRRIAQLAHGPEHGPGAPRAVCTPRAGGAATQRGQRLQCRAHRLRVRVVGVVDHGDAVRAVDDLHPPPRGRAGRRQRGGDALRRGAALQRHRRGGQGVADVVRPDQPQRHLRRALRGDQPEPRAARCERQVFGAHGRLRRPADGHDAGPRPRRHGGDGRVVGVEHRHPVGRQCLHQLALRLGDRLRRAELAQVRTPDVEHHPDPRLRDVAQRGDVAASASGELQHQVAGAGVGTQCRPGQAQLVVERPGRGDGRAERGEDRGQQVLRRGLAGAAGDADDGEAGRPGPISTATLCAARRASAARTAAPDPSGSVAAR